MTSKLGFHRIGAAGAWREFLEGGGWGGVAVDDFGIAQEVASRWPDALLIGRKVESDAALDPVNDYRSGASPEYAAERFFARQAETYRLNPAISLWVGPNEPALSHGPNFPDLPLDECLRRMAWYATFEIWRLILLANTGLRGVVGNFSTGTPDRRLWSAFYPALESARAHGGYLGLHEYMGAKQRFGVGDNPLRYRTVPEIRSSGVQIVMPEFGFDQVQGPPGYVTGAWRDLAGQWVAHGDTTDPERYCADAYIWYAEELRKDPYVVGAAIFTSGDGGSPLWARHDIAGTRIPEHLKQYSLSMPPLEEPIMAGITEVVETIPRITARVRTLRDLSVRSASGEFLYLLKAGAERWLFRRDLGTVGPNSEGKSYEDRVEIVPGADNIYDDQEVSPSLEYL